MTKTILPKHFLRYGIHGDQRYFSELRDTYEGVAINGNMLAHTPAALARFVGHRTPDKPFLVDPLTHGFQHDPKCLMAKPRKGEKKSSGELKQSVGRMSALFGELVTGKAGRQALLPKDFQDVEKRRDFCKRVIEFQVHTAERAAEDGDYVKYLKYAGIDAMKPTVVIAPYFYMISNTVDDWLPINLQLVDESRSCASQTPVYAQLVISQDVLLREHRIQQLGNAYGSSPCDGVCIWVDDLDEHMADEDILLGLVRLIRMLSASKKPVFNMYGGYFSTLLTAFGSLSGLCHGLEYGESRPVVPVGGGLPIARYYYPPLHRRLRFSDAYQLMESQGYTTDVSKFHANVCNCEVCRSVIAGDMRNIQRFGEAKPATFQRMGQTVTMNYPLPETRDLCLRHYLHCKRYEFSALETTKRELAFAQLADACSQYEGVLSFNDMAFAKTWITALETA